MLALPLYDDTPRRRPALTTYGLIGGCVAVFLWQESLGPRAAAYADYAFGMIPAVLFGHAELPHPLQQIPPWASLITSMFLHGGWLHLIGNMIYLWLFGRGVEAALGSLRYLGFYLLCGVAAALTQAGMNPQGTVPMIGASGAIAGTLGAYLLLYPHARVMVLIWVIIIVRLIAVPAVVLLGLWFLLQLLSAVTTTSGAPGVAFWAHVGGFVIGMLLLFLFRRPQFPLLPPRHHGPFGRGSVPSAGRRRRPAEPGWW
ncbi:MAG TPA: rhomboid family intramembrane serine protease [Acetobacteraceae bacterium]|nr:rhomboid family intramembrane serine protease [Acetobacteraceae bacterium]